MLYTYGGKLLHALTGHTWLRETQSLAKAEQHAG
jgi:hypothetical protein